ncbi:head-tail adaptor protein [Alicyclobacillus contaminans]|uniref:phage head closure protein n=1 Tax=Alicyclobacillus contaminans TaxID=392016 RepID=UPI0003F80BE5|nr:phage head closure protein [Alicyclobacillus contaminans]GMA48660.1 head-tail adaptor protein [Alicyclobacillus contaminans]GMA52613.1 head-tail adaptor protein [Alicyclobacillus contaminans]
MSSADYRHRVTLQQKLQVVDDEGLPDNDAWEDVVTVWAAVEPQTLRAHEFVGAAANVVEKIVQVRIRYRPGVTESMRVVYHGRVFRIEAVVDQEERHRELQLYCREVEAGG